MNLSRTWCTAAALFLCAFSYLWFTIDDYGFVIDEATYVWVVEQVRLWFAEVPEQPWSDSFSQEGIARRWHFLEPPAARNAAEHSNFNLPVSHHLMNVSWRLFCPFFDDLTCYRLSSVLLFSTCIAATYVTLARRSSVAGWYGCLALLFCPRIFGHAHLAATETALGCLWTMTLLALAQMTASDRPRRWGMLAALLLSLTMGVKLTGWLLALPIGVWLLIYRPAGWKTALASAVLLPIPLMIALTPPLWHAPVTGLIDYISAAADNPWKIVGYFQGQGFRDGMPWWSALIITATTVPLSTLLLSVLALAVGWRDRLIALFGLPTLFLLAARCLGFVPQHDVERQFLPVFYGLCVLAGLGIHRLVRRRRPNTNADDEWSPKRRLAAAAIAVVLLIEPAVDTWIYRRHALSYYNRAVGGLRGARDYGFEISYWYEAMTDAQWKRFLGSLPRGTRLFLRPDHPGLEYLKRRKVWTGDLVSTGPHDADFYLLYGKRAALVAEDPESGRLVDSNLSMLLHEARAYREITFQGVRLAVLIPVSSERQNR